MRPRFFGLGTSRSAWYSASGAGALPVSPLPVLASALVAVLLAGCSTKKLEREISPPERAATIDGRAPFLKVHLEDGRLYSLSSWTIDQRERVVRGTGVGYALDRSALPGSTFSVPLDSVALFETNVVKESGPSKALTLITGASVALTAACLTNPKACFGSCPTFYLSDGEGQSLQAEGFSSSVAPALEARDIDALFRAQVEGKEVAVEVRNEALETHVIRYANLLAAPRQPGERVIADLKGRFWRVAHQFPPSRCTAPEGDCTAALAAFDAKERFSLADSSDLAAREIVELEFKADVQAPALVLASRQSLLPSYLFYQGLAYLGSSAGAWIAGLSRPGASRLRPDGLVRALGGIEVLVPGKNGEWASLAEIQETGPLASDVRLVALPEAGPGVQVKLRMAKGAWRIDAAWLVSLIEPVEPLRVQPSEVRARGNPVPEALSKLLDPSGALVTLPGERYTLIYRLDAPASSYELFLESQGYYLEWLRSEWLEEENPALAAEMLFDPRASLKRLAPQFKRIERQLETAFWQSKYAGAH